jgi:hypothetical protein
VEDAHQEQQPPPQQPPPVGSLEAPDLGVPDVATPVTETMLSSRTVSSWPPGQGAGASASAMGRVTSKVSPHVRQRMS